MATFIPTEKKKSILAGIGESVANAAMTVMKHKKDSEYYTERLAMLGGLEKLNNEPSVGATAIANTNKSAMPKQRSAEDMAEWDDSDSNWTNKIAKAQGVDLKQPAFIANQPGFMKAQAAVAQREVTPSLGEEQMQGYVTPTTFKRSTGKLAFHEFDDIPSASFDYGAGNDIVPSGGGGDGRVGPLSPTQLEVLKSTKRPSSTSPMAQDLAGAVALRKVQAKNVAEEASAPATHWMTDAERDEFYANPDSTVDPVGRYEKDRKIKDRADPDYPYMYKAQESQTLAKRVAEQEPERQAELLRKAGYHYKP